MAVLTSNAIWLQRKLEEVACYVSALAVATMMTLTMLEVLARALFSKSMPGAYEYVSLMFVYLIYLGLAYSQRRDAHITVGILYDYLPRSVQKTTQAIYLSVAFLFFAALTWTSGVSAFSNYVMGDTVLGVIEVKTWWARAGIPVGLALFALRFLTQLICLFTKNELLEEAAVNDIAALAPVEDEKSND
ncbi:TRAP-type C4-dicarboxylate transport system permease small subunit [Shimia isoporae]|uniref:TRAP transporter small permease protein n=1 Tax=Shimia isoporae TaxID=647720 RepID=A0A4R1N271_9RHOB|nr:TRAP transporter small permease [Shimia isoporae]TCK99299.1 TRAP-type C4-dicarboxylate transport system permease small subunit [Shimia isoporae]